MSKISNGPVKITILRGEREVSTAIGDGDVTLQVGSDDENGPRVGVFNHVHPGLVGDKSVIIADWGVGDHEHLMPESGNKVTLEGQDPDWNAVVEHYSSVIKMGDGDAE